MIIETIVAALVPVGAEAVKQLINKFTGGVKPATIDEQIRLDQNDIERTKALAALDTPIGQPSQWVVDLRASARYVGALVVILVGVFGLFAPIDDSVKSMGLEAANIAFGFLFGSRIVSHWRK
jgi:hypothetical protein